MGRSKSEVWVLAGSGDKSTGDQGQGNHGGQESGEVLDNVATVRRGELERGLASNTSETPRSTTTGTASSSVRRRLEAAASRSNEPRSHTSNQALASGSHQGSGRRSMEGGVTMQVEMVTEKGKESITYRVKLTTPMQKVIDKVSTKLGKQVDQVVLTRNGNLVDPTAMAAIYTNTKLVASVL